MVAVTDALNSLAAVPIFADLDPAELAAIAAVVQEESYLAGYPLLIQGVAATEMAIIAEGAVTIVRGDTPIASLGPGDIVGEIALVSRERRTASAVTSAPTRLWVLDADDFETVVADHPAVGDKVRRIVNERLAELDG